MLANHSMDSTHLTGLDCPGSQRRFVAGSCHAGGPQGVDVAALLALRAKHGVFGGGNLQRNGLAVITRLLRRTTWGPRHLGTSNRGVKRCYAGRLERFASSRCGNGSGVNITCLPPALGALALPQIRNRQRRSNKDRQVSCKRQYQMHPPPARSWSACSPAARACPPPPQRQGWRRTFRPGGKAGHSVIDCWRGVRRIDDSVNQLHGGAACCGKSHTAADQPDRSSNRCAACCLALSPACPWAPVRRPSASWWHRQ